MAKFERLSKLCDEITELQARVRKAAQEEFKPALQEVVQVLRNEVPGVEALRWQQWIPGFNDGEPCEFEMGEVRFKFDNPELDAAGEYENGYIEADYDSDRVAQHKNGQTDSYLYGLSELVVKDLLTHDQAVLLNEIANSIGRLHGAAEIAFGPDVEITLQVDDGSLEIEEYDCGY
jgi:hypothetical protein